jgi:hypothetical protein
MKNCKLSQLKNINSRAFNSSSLQKLIFNENRYRFDKKIHYDSKEIEIFHFLPNIRELQMLMHSIGLFCFLVKLSSLNAGVC